MKSTLPVILVILALTGAIAYSLAKRSLPEKTVENEATAIVTPTPKATPTVSIPEVTEKSVTKGGQAQVAKTTVTKTIICTPVYGAAETCTEHIVVDTGAENALFFNFAGLAYLGGLISFIKAKSLKH
jgi:hypothetical protein